MHDRSKEIAKNNTNINKFISKFFNSVHFESIGFEHYYD